MLIRYFFDGGIITSLDFRPNDDQAFFAIAFIHPNQMGHRCNARASPHAPVFQDNDLALEVFLGGIIADEGFWECPV